MRLCTLEELAAGHAANTGCIFDLKEVWSSTDCDGGAGKWTWIKSQNKKTCRNVDYGASIRCCADDAPTAETISSAPLVQHVRCEGRRYACGSREEAETACNAFSTSLCPLSKVRQAASVCAAGWTRSNNGVGWFMQQASDGCGSAGWNWWPEGNANAYCCKGSRNWVGCWDLGDSKTARDEFCAGDLKCARVGHDGRDYGCTDQHCCTVAPTPEPTTAEPTAEPTPEPTPEPTTASFFEAQQLSAALDAHRWQTGVLDNTVYKCDQITERCFSNEAGDRSTWTIIDSIPATTMGGNPSITTSDGTVFETDEEKITVQTTDGERITFPWECACNLS